MLLDTWISLGINKVIYLSKSDVPDDKCLNQQTSRIQLMTPFKLDQYIISHGMGLFWNKVNSGPLEGAGLQRST